MSLKKNIASLNKMKTSGAFHNYIEYIRYPHYRNLEADAMITFDFPITFLIGKNGGGKSSTLQSLYGCPLGYSLGDYWFSTAVDPIKELKDDRNCFIYGYQDQGQLKEVLKQRAHRKGNLDYWEPSRPVKKYGMKKGPRNPPISKHVEYIDFRSELSAYDRFMYFTPFKSLKTVKSKQDYIRRHSSKLKEAFDKNKPITHFGIVKNEPVKTLTEIEVEAVSQILGKEYTSIEIIDHKFFKNWGFSVRFKSTNLHYSEAFAGSGETAVIVLVNKIYSCPRNSLLLLDEPETSLHPGAQIRLRDYLIDQAKRKQLQIIISTHSPFFIKEMPANSIKVFSTNIDASFHVENEREPREAFYELEITDSNDNILVLVEDELAKSLIEYCLFKKGKDVLNSFVINYLPGGSSSIKQRITSYTEIGPKPFIIFDGDQKVLEEHINLDELSKNKIDTFEKLHLLLQTQTNCEIKFFIDGSKGAGNVSQKIKQITQYFNFYKNQVFYLPKNIPEDIIWDDKYAIKKLKDIHGSLEDDEKTLKEIKTGNSKEWFLNLCIKIFNDTTNLGSLQKEFIIKWYNKNDKSLSEINKIIEVMRTSQSEP